MELEEFEADIYNAGAPWNKDWPARIKKVWEKTLIAKTDGGDSVPCNDGLSAIEDKIGAINNSEMLLMRDRFIEEGNMEKALNVDEARKALSKARQLLSKCR